MSRGLGRLQRRLLKAFEALDGTGTVLDVAEYVHGTLVAVGSSEYESARRAVKSLVKRGLLRRFRGGHERVTVKYIGGPSTSHHHYGLPHVVEARYRAFRAGPSESIDL